MKAPKLSHVWDRDEHDWYVEPQWVTERLLEQEEFAGEIHDPACGQGNIVKAVYASPHNYTITCSDIVLRGQGWVQALARRRDFLKTSVEHDNIISNPPFKLCDAPDGTHPFVDQCLKLARRKVALLLPARWLFGAKRSAWLEQTPLQRIYFITPRPSMPPGAVLQAGEKPGGGTQDFVWLVWDHPMENYGRPSVAWLRR
jgi:hypothetical protein